MKQLILITESVINHFLPPLIESPQYSTSLLQVCTGTCTPYNSCVLHVYILNQMAIALYKLS